MTGAAESTDVDLLVVGGGPTGIAALFEARRAGLRAVALDAATRPGSAAGASVRAYLNGLVLISRPTDYEVAGIPLDCRDPNQLTREEVLHYLGRIVNAGRLDIRAGELALELTPAATPADPVLVRTPRGVWRARNVIVTAWYRRRRLSRDLAAGAAEGGVTVIEALRDAVAVAGRATVILGGGLSAFEQATAVMMLGQPVTIVSRHVLPAAFRTAHFEALLAATGSRVVEAATEISLSRQVVSYRLQTGGTGSVSCEALVACLGQEVDPGVQAMLVAAGVLTEAEAAQVASSPTPDSMIRHGRSVPEAINGALATWPDFRTRLLGGVGGIRLAGGGLHIGGAHSGVRVSIETARLAVRDAAGDAPPSYLAAPLPDGGATPLPMALARFVQSPPREAPPEVLGALRPLRITSWSRTTMALRSRDSFEARPEATGPGRAAGGAGPGDAPYLLAPQPADPQAREFLRDILARADGSHSVAAIAAALGAPFPEGWRRLIGPLRFLWHNNAMTWLPGELTDL